MFERPPSRIRHRKPALNRCDSAQLNLRRRHRQSWHKELSDLLPRIVLRARDRDVAARLREPQLLDVEHHELAPPKRPRVPEQQRPIARRELVARHRHQDRRQLLDAQRLLLPHGRSSGAAVAAEKPAHEGMFRRRLQPSRRRSVGNESPTVPAARPAGERLRWVSRVLRYSASVCGAAGSGARPQRP